jgi:hypothetical protein
MCCTSTPPPPFFPKHTQIKEYLETGNVAALHGDKSLPAGKVQKEALEDAGAADALKYM